MKNNYKLEKAEVIKVAKENSTTKNLFLRFRNQKTFEFLAGQFMMVGLPGFGECPISISSNPKDSKKHFSLTISAAGELTSKLNFLKPGDSAWARGPFGNGFPEVTKNLILIGGGCGFIPLRSVYEENKTRKYIKIQLLFGCAARDSLVFAREYQRIKKRHDLKIILEKETMAGFGGQKGFVTELIKKEKLLPNALVFVCGPEAMYRFVAKELLAKGVPPAEIYFSMEKRMHCGVGVCQHCAVGTKYVCRDGPVFDYEFLSKNKYL